MALPATMQACVRRGRGPPSRVLAVVDGLPVPAAPGAASDEVLIRVSHVALQYSSGQTMATVPALPGLPWLPWWSSPSPSPSPSPWIPELELSGEVVAAGGRAPAAVRAAGTRVIAATTIPNLLRGRGVLAEYVRLPGARVARLDVGAAADEETTMAAAAGVIGVGCTALRMLRTAGVRAGQAVLVNGAGGSVGGMVVQLCKRLPDGGGAASRVVGIASGASAERVRALGADAVIDYTQHAPSSSSPLPAFLAAEYGDRPFDVVFDCVGTQALFAHAPAYLAPGGILVRIGTMGADGDDRTAAVLCHALANTARPAWLGGVPRRFAMFSTQPEPADFARLAQLLADGAVRVPVDSVFPLAAAAQAYERVATKRARGKVVIRVGGGGT